MNADKALSWLVMAIGAAAAAWFAVHAARAVAFPFPLDYGEGPLVDQARRLAHGDGIYRAHVSSYPYTVANYPPLYPALLAVAGAAAGWSYPVFRGVTAVAALGCAALVFDVVRLRTGDLRAAFVGASAFLASPYVVFWSTLVRVDFVALAFGLAALRLSIRAPEKKWTPALCALFAACAVLTRQSHLLAAPLAVAGALALVRPARALVFLGALAALAGGALATLDAMTRGGLYFDLVTANANHFSFPLLGVFFADLAATSGVVVCLAIVTAAVSTRAQPGAVAPTLYLAGAALSAVAIGKVGAHVNYFLELVAALAVFAGLAFAHRGRLRPLFVVAVGAGIACMGAFAATRPENMTQKLALRGEFEELRAIVAAEPGRVLADETMGVLPIAGRPILLQPFEFTQLVEQGVWRQDAVLADVRAGAFSLILVNDGPRTPEAWWKERWTPELLVAIHEAYEAQGALADATLYRPRRKD